METHGKNPQKNVIAVIPARYSSVRLPGKLLLPIGGKSLVLHTVDRARAASLVSRVIVATDDLRIVEALVEAGVETVMTSDVHQSGTDRIAEVAEHLPPDSVVVNVQGDEPLIDPETIDRAVRALIDDPAAQMSTTFEPITRPEDVMNGNVVKLVVGDNGCAQHFSRSPIPFPRDAALRHSGDPAEALKIEPELLSLFRKHTGLYVYRREYLLRLSRLPQTSLERIEMLEQLRALEDGARIRVVEAASSSIGVDTQADYDKVRRRVESQTATIRTAGTGDVVDVARVHVDSWKGSFRGIAPADYLNSMSVERREEVLNKRLSDPTYRLLVADAPGSGIVGFIDYGAPDFDNYGYDARVYSFYVLPEFQRLGLGQRLFEQCAVKMSEEGFRSMCLDTLEMSPYRRFYEKTGGRVVAHDRHMLGDVEFPTIVYGWDDLAV